ncbi:MAG: DMT family transporter [Anaerolineae bacterium]|nr:DMT family transporter [Anaerolineae bacterium]
MTSRQLGIVYGLLAAAIWGGMYVVSDVVLQVIPPFTLLTIRLLLGILVLALILIARRPAGLPKNVPSLLAVGFLGFGVSVGLQFVGTDLSTAVNGALITSAAPAFILIFAALLLREQMTMRRVLAVALASVGVLLIVDLTKVDLSSDLFLGNAALVGAALTWGLYSVLVRRVSETTDTLMVTLIAFCGGLLLTIPLALIELQSRPIGTIDVPVVLGILYLGVVSTAGAMWFWNRAFALVDAGTASLTFFAQPLVGALLGALLLGQSLTGAAVIGGLLIAAGVLLAMRRA